MWLFKRLEFFVIKQLQSIVIPASTKLGGIKKYFEFSLGHFWDVVHVRHERSNV